MKQKQLCIIQNFICHDETLHTYLCCTMLMVSCLVGPNILRNNQNLANINMINCKQCETSMFTFLTYHFLPWHYYLNIYNESWVQPCGLSNLIENFNMSNWHIVQSWIRLPKSSQNLTTLTKAKFECVIILNGTINRSVFMCNQNTNQSWGSTNTPESRTWSTILAIVFLFGHLCLKVSLDLWIN